MLNKKKIILGLAFLIVAFTLAAPAASAKDGEYDQIVKHLKTKYQAKKVKIPFMWLARFAVSVVRPAGVKSFSVTLFEDLKFSAETVDLEMQKTMRNSLGKEWSALLRVRSRQGQQVYMYMREDGNSVKIMLVAVDKQQSAVVRATVNPERLADFINDPKVFGISLNDTDHPATEKPADAPPAKVVEEVKKDN
jgi:hypothetical protein